MRSWSPRMLGLAVAPLLATAAVIALAIRPAVRTDTFPGATPNRAVPAFWVNVVLNSGLAVAAVAVFRARYRVLLSLVGLITLLLAVALVDAATAYPAHGPSMHGVVVALWVCVCFDMVGGVSMVVSAVMSRR